MTEAYKRARWPQYLQVALAKAADAMDQPASIAALSWEAVFGDTYDQRSRP